MSEQIQKLESTIIALKARAFDTQEQLAAFQDQSQQFTEALKAIADAVGITGETVQLNDIVEAVKALAPMQHAIDGLEVEPE